MDKNVKDKEKHNVFTKKNAPGTALNAAWPRTETKRPRLENEHVNVFPKAMPKAKNETPCG